jgi:hypothetical protein
VWYNKDTKRKGELKMKYKFENKVLDIPDEELDKLVDKLEISLAEAIDIWLEDNDYTMCEETKELEEKAKKNKITATIHQAKASVSKERKKVERKPDEVKDSLVEDLAKFLEDYATNISITKIGKLVEFDIGDDHYKLDLIRQRKPKGKA